jgi:hypothetical protein
MNDKEKWWIKELTFVAISLWRDVLRDWSRELTFVAISLIFIFWLFWH